MEIDGQLLLMPCNLCIVYTHQPLQFWPSPIQIDRPRGGLPLRNRDTSNDWPYCKL